MHRCIFDRNHSRLRELSNFISNDSLMTESFSCNASTSGYIGVDLFNHSTNTTSFLTSINLTGICEEINIYVNRLSQLTGSLMKCYPVLKFLEVLI